ncbi:entericidin A/B family lipoprotein [Thiohalorhabdus methylotrophus]|uniref:Entericidin A/B family lipoprotein n=1 Tax=Thiohalorhabdus methylotrophus TaxID=3242694 RepID=A0ABV4TY38_9GAMM
MSLPLWKQTAKTALALFFALAVAGCNTMEGAGEDMEEAGEETQDAAE